MGFHPVLKQVSLFSLLLAGMAAAPLAAPVALPNCRDRCGDVEIPFPFGLTKECSVNADFLLSCDESFGRRQTESSGRLRTGDLPVTSISVQGQLEIEMPIAIQCLSNNVVSELRVPSFTVNVTQNVFMAVGCDSVGYLDGDNEPFPMGCLSFCLSRTNHSAQQLYNSREPIAVSTVLPKAPAKFKCSGIGCCQVEILPGMKNFILSAYRFGDRPTISPNRCSVAFFVKQGLPHFSPDSVSQYPSKKLPVVLDWAIGNKTCSKSKPKCGRNGECHDPENVDGFRCKCKDGYEGNPYLPDGCQDIDECRLNLCNGNATCENTVGNFTCRCKSGYEGYGRGESGCKPASVLNSVTRIALGIGVGFATLLVAGSWLYLVFKQKKFIERKEKFFEQNGGLILKDRLREQGASTEGIKILTIEELEKATKNFDERSIIGHGGFGTVYKGILPGNRIIAIKKSRTMAQSQIDQFINEIVVLSQINHRNIVKLLGCCLETKVPLLVYEFIPKGSLFKHIHYESNASPLTWEVRLRIIVETAEAISYLHSTTIIHRDIKSTNILLDNDFKVKVSDFGTSKLVLRNQKEVATVVQGTFGYLDPEYLQTNQLTEKSDVYSFGVVIVELLTGEEIFSSNRSDDEINLVIYFLLSLEKGRLFNVLEKYIVEHGDKEQIKEVVELAKRCLKVKGDKRPTMKEVAIELKRIKNIEKHMGANPQSNPTEAITLHAETSYAYKDERVGSGTIGFDSMTNQATLGLKDGR